jgi:hypothetical protein
VVLLVLSKPPVTTAKALVLLTGTATARSPVIAVGKGVVVVQVTLLTLNVTFCTRFSVTPLLVPPAVTTVTVTVPGSVNAVLPLPEGTITTMLLSDHPDALGVTLAVMFPCVKTTLPGALRKLLPFTSIARPTGLEGVVELLMFDMEGGGGGAALPQPEKLVITSNRIAKEVVIKAQLRGCTGALLVRPARFQRAPRDEKNAGRSLGALVTISADVRRLATHPQVSKVQQWSLAEDKDNRYTSALFVFLYVNRIRLEHRYFGYNPISTIAFVLRCTCARPRLGSDFRQQENADA